MGQITTGNLTLRKPAETPERPCWRSKPRTGSDRFYLYSLPITFNSYFLNVPHPFQLNTLFLVLNPKQKKTKQKTTFLLAFPRVPILLLPPLLLLIPSAGTPSLFYLSWPSLAITFTISSDNLPFPNLTYPSKINQKLIIFWILSIYTPPVTTWLSPSSSWHVSSTQELHSAFTVPNSPNTSTILLQPSLFRILCNRYLK